MSEVQISMSAEVGALAKALAKAQREMRPAVKDAKNPHFKNTYATLASCVDALGPLHDNGIAVIQPPALHGTDGVCVTTMLIHESGQWIRGEIYMPASKKDPQGFGSALSYARRYCLLSTAGLATDDDDGEATRIVSVPSASDSAPNATEQALAGMFDEARTTQEIAAAETAAAKAIADKRIVNGARERLLKRRSAAIARVEASL